MFMSVFHLNINLSVGGNVTKQNWTLNQCVNWWNSLDSIVKQTGIYYGNDHQWKTKGKTCADFLHFILVNKLCKIWFDFIFHLS